MVIPGGTIDMTALWADKQEWVGPIGDVLVCEHGTMGVTRIRKSVLWTAAKVELLGSAGR